MYEIFISGNEMLSSHHVFHENFIMNKCMYKWVHDNEQTLILGNLK
jgi:hypothetical protein